MDQSFIGTIQYYAFDFAPKNWATCSGQLLSIAQNTALFSLLGTTYGGDGRVTFGLPDYRSRVINGYGGTHSMGERAGTETVSLITNNMPVHTHTVPVINIKANNANGTVASPQNGYAAKPDNRALLYGNAAASNKFLGAPSVVVGTTGGGTPFNIVGPYLALTCCICLYGIFPSRN